MSYGAGALLCRSTGEKDIRVTNLAFEVCMHKSKSALLVAVLILFSSLASWPQIAPTNDPGRNSLSVRPVDRVAGQIDETQVVALPGSRHPSATPKNATGDVPQDQRMERMVLVLRADSAQEKALEELIRAQQDPGSPYYHQWLTPQSFGKRFGISQNDLAQVVKWLQGHGMEVNEIPASGRSVVFSGSVAQVQSAFHTSIRKYLVGGESHYANATDPEIPQAFAGVIHGVVSLHDFLSASQIVVSAPTYTAGNGAHFLAPKDWDTIYDVTPLYGQGLDGTGQSIAVLGRVDVALSDVRTFRSNSGLPANDPQMIVNGPDPGFPDCNDEAESALDVEWAGAIAKNASVKFVTSKSGATDGINLSAQYAVNHNVAPIVSLSYGLCEAAYSSAGNAFWNGLWAQAASQGMSVFVSAGDSGAAGCDSMNTPTATHGRGVNALCSSPYSTCVGATQFNDVYNPEVYWSATNGSGMSSVLSYIPEVAWNESGWSNALFSSGGGASDIYAKPSWQTAPGVPADGKRDVPDVSMAGAIHDAYIIQIQGGMFLVAGTSAATPSLASVMAMVLQKNGTSQGNVNPILYTLATLQLSSNGAAVFHDITSGNNSVPGVTGYNAGIGYDQATGLGSVDANLLVNHWSDRVASSFSLTPSSSTVLVARGSSNNVTLTETTVGSFNSPVTLSASGAPSGVTVTFSSATLTTTAPVTATVAAGSNAVAGTYTITATGTGGGLTQSLPLTVTIAVPNFTLTPSATGASVARGGSIAITLSTATSNGFNTAIALSASGLPTGVTASLSPTSIAAPGNGSSTLTLAADSSTTAGSYNLTITATGGGVTRTSPLSLTIVAPSSFTLTPSPTSASVVVGSPARITLTTATSNGFNSAVALSVTGLPNKVTAAFSPTSIAAPGSGSSTLTLTETTGATSGTYNLTVTATGGGVTKTSQFSLTVAVPSFTLTPSATSATVTAGGSARVTVSTAALNGFNSSVALSVSGLPSGVTASFAPTSIAAPGSGSSTLTLAAVASKTAGSYNLTITATGGGITKPSPLSLTVAVPSITLTSSVTSANVLVGSPARITLTTTSNGLSSAVTLSVSGLPKGVTAGFSPASIAAPGSGTSTLTLTETTGAASGTYNLTVTATGGGVTKTLILSLKVVTQSFTMTLGGTSVSMKQGGSMPITVTTAAVSGFNSAVALSVTGLPKGVTATFAAASIAAPGNGSSTLTLKVASGTGANVGTYSLTVTGIGGGVTQSQRLALAVTH
jgi:subtilase family serine protease